MRRNQKVALLKALQAGNKSVIRQLVPESVKVYMTTQEGEYTINGKPISKDEYEKGIRNAITVDFTMAM